MNLEDLKKRPNSAGAEVINICNANCSFCGYGKGENGKAADPRVKQKIDVKALKHFLKIYSEGGGGNFSLTPILGEVSAHPNWLDLVKEIKIEPEKLFIDLCKIIQLVWFLFTKKNLF